MTKNRTAFGSATALRLAAVSGQDSVLGQAAARRTALQGGDDPGGW